MKKTLLTTCLACAALGVYAQGTVALQNTAASVVVNSVTAANVAVGTTFRVALYYAAGEAGVVPADGAFSQIGANVGFFSPGRYNGGNRTAPTSTPGGSGWFQVRAWEYAYGSQVLDSFAAAMGSSRDPGVGRNALAGTSNKFFLPATGNPPTTPAQTLTGLQGFELVPVPEPGAIALGLLGLGTLLALRRRK